MFSFIKVVNLREYTLSFIHSFTIAYIAKLYRMLLFFVFNFFQAFTQVIPDMWNYLKDDKGIRHPEEYLSLPTR